MHRSGKSKTGSSAKNKKKAKSAKDTSSVSSTPPVSSTPEPAKDAPPISEGPPPDGCVLETPVPLDVVELQRLLEEKRLEMQRLASSKPLENEAQAVTITDKENILDVEKQALELNSGEVDGAREKRGGDTEVGGASETTATDAPDVTFKKDGRRKKKHKSLFPLSRGQDNRGKVYHLEDCVSLAQHKYGIETVAGQSTASHSARGGQGFSTGAVEAGPSARLHPGVGDGVHLGLFAERRAAYAMFREEGTYHNEAGNRDQSQHLDMWKGNLAGALSRATECNQLNSFLVAMAPLGGYDVWLETSEAYARQLEQSEDYTGAATYYLACHKIHKAVTVLRDNKLFREAVALASVRFSLFDPAFTEVYKAWASHLEAEGNYGQAAKCYLAINQPADAVTLLARKSDIPSLAAALRVSCITDQRNLTTSLMVRYLHECLMAGDWLEAQGLLANHSSVLSGSLIAAVHEVIVSTLTSQKLIAGDLFTEAKTNPWLQELCQAETHKMDNLSEWTVPLSNQATLLVSTVGQWFLHSGLDQTDTDVVLSLYDEICSAQQRNTQHLPTKQLLIELAFELTLGQLSCRATGVPDDAVPHWLQAVVMCHDVANMDIARGVLGLVLSEGIQSIQKLPQNTTVSSLRAHYLFSVLYHLWWELGNHTSLTPNPGLLSKYDPPIDSQQTLDTNCDTDSQPNHIESLKSSSGNTGDNSSSAMTRSDAGLTGNSGENTSDFSGLINRTTSQTTSNRNGRCTLETENPKQRKNSCPTSADSEIKSQVSKPSRLQEDSDHSLGTKIISLQETLCAKLSLISETLLSEPHAKLRNLRGRLRCIQQAVGGLVAKHTRKAQEGKPVGLASGQNGSSGPAVNIGDTTLLEHSLSRREPDSNKTIPDNPSDGKLANADLPLPLATPEEDAIETLGGAVDKNLTTEAKDLETNLKSSLSETPLPVEDASQVSLPSNWEELMADVKYSHPAVTYAVLLQEQQCLMQDLDELSSEVQDQCPFPDPMESALVLLHVCHAARRMMNASNSDQIGLQKLEKEATLWGAEHSWLTEQRNLFDKQLTKLD